MAQSRSGRPVGRDGVRDHRQLSGLAPAGLVPDERGRFRGGQTVLVTGDLPLLGFGLPVSGSRATPDTIRRTARRAEELRYASLWTFQPVPYPADGELRPSHRAAHDPVVPLALVAGHRADRAGDRDRLRAVPVEPSGPTPLARHETSPSLTAGPLR